MAITSPIANFTTTCNDGDADQYFVGKDLGSRCAWAFKWITGTVDANTMHKIEIYQPVDWISVDDMDTDLLDKELADVEARGVPHSAEATNQLANGTDESKRQFLIGAREGYPTNYYWPDPPPGKYLFRVDSNYSGWQPSDYSASNHAVFWDKFKGITEYGVSK